ncbi:MAG: glycosyltransferase [Planctomycetes bacterium]|nr:glycosyltransferase [Planctomycetota bacterium]
MKILHVITTLDVGGAEMHLLAQVRGQSARGHSVRVLWLKGAGALASDFRAAGAEHVEHVPAARFPLRARAHARWADVVHSHLLKADMLAAASAFLWGRGARLVSSKHNDEQVLRRAWVARVHGLLGRVPRRTIVLSDHVGRFVAEHGRIAPSKLVRIYYGLDPAPFEAAADAAPEVRAATRAELGLPADAVVFVCVARFAPQKALGDLLAGFSRARAARPGRELRLVLVGDDPFGDGRKRAEARAAELQLGESVLFAGIRRDVPRVLAACDVFTMTSLWEGLGLVFLEAMACRLPVLATRVSAVPEVVEDGRTGVLVPPSDPEAVAKAMLLLARDPARRAELGRNGARVVRDRFGLDRMIDATLDVYRAVLSDSGAPVR